MLGGSRLDGQLPSGLSALPVPLTRAGTSSRVAGVAGRVGSVGVSMGRMPRCHGGPSRAGRGGSAFATRARCVDGDTGWSSPSVALLRHWAADHWSYGSTGFWRQFGSSAQDDKHIGAGARRGAGLRDLAYGVSKLFSQPCVRLVALRVSFGPRVRLGGLSFLDRSTGEVGVRGAPGPSPPCTSEDAPVGEQAQAAFGRFWVAGRIGSWSVLVFGAKWIISGRQRVRCGRPACITYTCLWHNLRLVHRFEDYHGTRIINQRRTGP